MQQNAALRGQTTGTRARDKMVNATHDALRGQNTPPRVVRPGILAEPRPQRSDRSRRHSSGDGMPTLALPSLAGSAGEAVDGAALAFLTSRALAAQKEEKAQKQAQVRKLEEERRRQRRQALVQEIDAPELRCFPLSFVCWTRLLLPPSRGEKVEGEEEEKNIFGRVVVLVFDNDSGMLLAGFQCSLLVLAGPSCWTPSPVWSRKSVFFARRRLRQWHVQGWFCGYFAPRAVFLLWSLSAGPPQGLRHGRCGPGGQIHGEHGSDCEKLCIFHSCRRFSCRGADADSHGLAVQQTIVIPQLQFMNKVIDGGSCWFSHVVHMPVVCNDRCPVTFRSCSSSTRLSTPCRGRCPCCVGRVSSTVAVVRRQ